MKMKSKGRAAWMTAVFEPNSSRDNELMLDNEISLPRDEFCETLTQRSGRGATHTAVILSSRKVTKAMPNLFSEMRFFSALNSSVSFSSNSL